MSACDWSSGENRRMAEYRGEGKDGPPMTEACYEGQHQACDGRTIDGWPCGCTCGHGEPEPEED